ncbi:MAG: Lon protease-like protein [Myxococcota bacterium]|jgi:Lon protease-like protein
MDQRLERVCARLPVFPLPDTVLMPGALLPLHVFEPRYRALIQHCLDGDGLMGIATLRPGYEADYDGAPGFYDTLGVGDIIAHEGLPDGRYHILLRYVGRARVEDELAVDHAFRVVRAAVLPEDESGGSPGLQRLKLLLLQLGARSDDDDDPHRAIVEGGLELVDRVAHQVLQESEDRREYLELDRVVDRIAKVEEALAGMLARGTEAVGDA